MKLRIFIALNLPEELRDYVLEGQKMLTATGFSVKWVERENLHLTLEFLGEIEPFKLTKIGQAVAKAAEKNPPFQLFLQGAGVFPNLRRPRVLWGGIKGDTVCLKKLQQEVHQYLEKEGFQLEKREFTPHLTVGRIRHPKYSLAPLESQKLQQVLDSTFKDASPPWWVEKIDLMQSILGREGPQYIIHQTFLLKSRS